MVETKSQEITRTTGLRDVYDTVGDNAHKLIDEIAKSHPAYLRSISNLQQDYVHTVKNSIKTAISAWKEFASNVNFTLPEAYAEQFERQSNEFTNNLLRTIGTNNQLTTNLMDGARENAKIYSGTINAIIDFNTNVSKAWTSWYSVQQQQFSKL